MIRLDFSKVFDRVDYEALLFKSGQHAFLNFLIKFLSHHILSRHHWIHPRAALFASSRAWLEQLGPSVHPWMIWSIVCICSPQEQAVLSVSPHSPDLSPVLPTLACFGVSDLC